MEGGDEEADEEAEEGVGPDGDHSVGGLPPHGPPIGGLTGGTLCHLGIAQVPQCGIAPGGAHPGGPGGESHSLAWGIRGKTGVRKGERRGFGVQSLRRGSSQERGKM